MRLSLHDAHAALGARFVQQNDVDVPDDYGDWQAEHQAVRQSAGLIDLSDVGRLRGSGPDISQVLHGVVTNEVKNLPAGEGCLAALLNDVGRTQTLLVVLRTDDGFLIETPPGLAEKSRALIDYYIITEDAAVEDETTATGLLSLQGPAARELLMRAIGTSLPAVERPAFTHTTADLQGEPLRVVRRTRSGEDGYDLWIAGGGLSTVWTALCDAGARPVGRAALDVLRVEASIPRFGVDLGDDTIPLEAGLDEAISENKGCYLGQEIIARITNLSKPVRLLTGLLPSSAAQAGDKVRCGDKEVGWVTSAVDSPTLQRRLALAYVRTDVLARGEPVTVDGAPATVHRQPFYRAREAPVAVVPPSSPRQKLVPGL